MISRSEKLERERERESRVKAMNDCFSQKWLVASDVRLKVKQ